MNLAEYEQIVPHVTAHGLTWLTPNQHVAWRVDGLLKKEPDTILWLDTMQPGDILFDVGANIGQYSMWAAKRGVRVHAFEPESQNFALLCRNLSMNDLGGLVTPWALAISDEASLGTFHVTSLMAGGSCNSYGDALNYNLKPKDFAFRQGAPATTLSTFARCMSSPTHIKIDVDGFEHKVVRGMLPILPGVKSVLIEINTHLPEHMAILETMCEHGFIPDMATADRARRKSGPFEGVGNVIFWRSEDQFLSKKTLIKNSD